MMTDDLKWTEMSYTLLDIDSDLHIKSCIVKIEHGMELQSFLDKFNIKNFRNVYNIRAYKISSNKDIADVSTYSEEVIIPVNCANRGSIVPLYGVSYVFKTVEEMIMAFPRFVEVQEDLTFCSNNSLVHLKSGDHLELLKVEKVSSTAGDILTCRNKNGVKFYLNASSIGRFKTLPDPYSYNLNDVLKILKLPQIIKFEGNVNYTADLQSAQYGSGKIEYSGLFLLVGLKKCRAAVIGPIANKDKDDDDDSGYILSLDSDLFKHLKYHLAFMNEYKSLKITESRNTSSKLDKDSVEMLNKFSPDGTASDAEDIYQMPNVENNNFYSTYYTQATAPFPESSKKSSYSGEKIAKKMNTAIQSLKTKLKKSSPKELATICRNMTPVSAPQISKTIYPNLSKMKLSSESMDNIYYDIGDISLKGKSRFFSSAYATVNPNIESNTAVNRQGPGNKSKEFSNNVGCGTDKELSETPPPLPGRNLGEYTEICFDKTNSLENLNMNEGRYVNSNSVSTLKVCGRRSGVFGHKNTSQSDDSTLMDNKVDFHTDHRKSANLYDLQTGHDKMVNPNVATDQRSEIDIYDDITNVHSRMVNQEDEVKTDEDNAIDRDVNGDGLVDTKHSTELCPDDLATDKNVDVQSSDMYLNETAPYDTLTASGKKSNETSTITFSSEIVNVNNSSEDNGNICDDIKGNTSPLPTTPSQQTSAPTPKPKPKQKPSPTAVQQKSNPTPPPKPSPKPPKPSPTAVLQQKSDPTPPLKPSPKPRNPSPKPRKPSPTAVLREKSNPTPPLKPSPKSTPESSPKVVLQQKSSPIPPLRRQSLSKSRPRKTSISTATSLVNRPPLPIPQPTLPKTTISPSTTASPSITTASPPPTTTTPPTNLPKTTTPSMSPQHKPKESEENSFKTASVKEMCILLECCGLHRMKDICQENCLDGWFISNLSESSLQETPFMLSSIELMKLKMMMQGWKPKME